MTFLFVSTIYPKERLEEIKNNSLLGVDNASDNFQWALIKGLDYYLKNISIISLPFIRSFPNGYKKFYFKKSFFSHKAGVKDICIGFPNIFLIKNIFRYISLYKILKKQISKEEKVCIIVYGPEIPYLKATDKLKKNGYNIKICVIIPDLPVFTITGNWLRRFLKKLECKIIDRYNQSTDSYVILSDYMPEKFNLHNKPFVRIEGIYNGDKIEEDIIKNPYKTILYTGKAAHRDGVLNLINAFKKIDSNEYRLWIRCHGDLVEKIKDSIKNDYRIGYFEEMSRDDILKLQKKATVLINVTPTSESFSKYFFPSKTMDYLASGTPTIMTKLESIPLDYYPFIYFVEVESIDGIKNKIIEICSKSSTDLEKFGKDASNFIFENKNPIVQVGKLLELLNNI